MQFQLSEEQVMTREVIRDFAESIVAPAARERDEKEHFDRDLFDKLGEMGLTGVPWPEQYGGSGSDYVTYAVVLEELARKCASTAGMLATHIGYCGSPIYYFGNEEQRNALLKASAEGALLGSGTIGHGRWNETADSGIGINVSTDGDGYILNGTIDNVNHAGEADIYVVFARREREPGKRKKGYSAFLIKKGMKGLSYGTKMRKLGMRSMTTGPIGLDNCRVPSGNLIGQEGSGLTIAMTILGVTSMSTAAQAVGIAQEAMDAAVAYAKKRKQFGRTIGQQQGISFKFADMSTKIEAARLLTYQAAWRMDVGLSHLIEAAMAQSFAIRAAEFATIEAVQVLGGYGYMREYEVERYMRDARCLAADEGTAEMRASLLSSMLAE